MGWDRGTGSAIGSGMGRAKVWVSVMLGVGRVVRKVCG